jgi:hypothetical protein
MTKDYKAVSASALTPAFILAFTSTSDLSLYLFLCLSLYLCLSIGRAGSPTLRSSTPR